MSIKCKCNLRSVLYVAVAGIVLSELILFLTGQFLLWQRRTQINSIGAVPIVCVGDSHTFGIGTSVLYSYPAQLEQLLRLNNDQPKFSVINLGIPGSSTRRQSQELASYLKEHRARVVIVLTGRNNGFEIEQGVDKKNKTVSEKIRYQLVGSRIFRFLKLVCESILRRDQKRGALDDLPGNKGRYAEYMSTYLAMVRSLCLDSGAKLVLLSYYNSADSVVRDYALKHRIPYFDFTSDFTLLFKAADKTQYISPDKSHMNRLGYKFFAEQLYRRLFLEQGYLGFRINPLLRTMQEADFYSDPLDVKRILALQEERLAKSRNSSEYPFELIHLGHIYTEIGREKEAKDCYEKALVASDYKNNNTIVSPIIDWHLKRGEKNEALAICDEILRHDPENGIAMRYRAWLLAGPQGSAGR